jgi:hypothetical protein
MMNGGQGYFVRMLWPDVLQGQGSDHCTSGGLGNPPPMYDVDYGWNMIGVRVCDCNDDGWITQPDVENCDYTGPCDEAPCQTTECNNPWLDADTYLASMNVDVGGLNPAYVYKDEARTLRYWEPWAGRYQGAMWKEYTRCEPLKVGRGYWMWASLDGLSIIPPVSGAATP